MSDISALRDSLRDFAAARDWEQFHTPKNLAMALIVEAAELTELFQWLTPDEALHPPDELKAKATDEIADVLLYLIRIADVLDIDPIAAAQAKIKKNAIKYPAP